MLLDCKHSEDGEHIFFISIICIVSGMTFAHDSWSKIVAGKIKVAFQLKYLYSLSLSLFLSLSPSLSLYVCVCVCDHVCVCVCVYRILSIIQYWA